MHKLTLDTNALRYWAQSKSLIDEVKISETSNSSFNLQYLKLENYRIERKCEIAVPPQIFCDFAKEPTGNLAKQIEKLMETEVNYTSPSLSTFPLHFPIIYFSKEQFEEIFNLVFPHSMPTDKKFKSNQIDALLLYAHKITDRKFFIIEDRNILIAAEGLFKNFSIEVLSINQLLNLLSAED